MFRHVITFIAIIFTSQAVAQSWYSGGFIDNEGDSTKGFIELTESNFNPETFAFKKSKEGADVQKYTIRDVRSFWYDFGDRYIRFDVSMSMHFIDPDHLETTLPPNVSKTVFLKKVATGDNVTLYSYQDEIKKRFYMQTRRMSLPQELPFLIVKNDVKMTHRIELWAISKYEYRDVLAGLAQQTGTLTEKLRGKIKRALYRPGDIIPIINTINGLKSDEGLARTKGGRDITIGLGAMKGQYKFMDNSELSKNGSGSSDMGFWASIGYDMVTNPRVGKFVIRTRLQFSMIEFNADTYDKRFVPNVITMEHQFTQMSAAAQLGGLLNLHNAHNFKFFIGAGVRLNYWKYDYDFVITTVSPSTTTVNNSKRGEPKKMGVGIPFSAGLLLSKRIEIGATYVPTIRLNAQDARYKYGVSMIEAGITYHLQTERGFSGQ